MGSKEEFQGAWSTILEEGSVFKDAFVFKPAKVFFHLLDTNNDGLITLDEFKRGVDNGDEEFAKIDTNNDGEISEEEFQRAFITILRRGSAFNKSLRLKCLFQV